MMVSHTELVRQAQHLLDAQAIQEYLHRYCRGVGSLAVA